MTDRENLQIAAYERTQALLSMNISLIQGITRIIEAKTALESSINAIRQINVEEEKGTGGAIVNFNKDKDTLIQNTLTVQGALVAYATGENDNSLLEAADFGISHIRRAHNEALYDKCKLIYDLALPFENLLISDYQLPQGTIAQFNIALEAYRLALPHKGLAKNERTANTRRRKAAFAQATEIMTKLSKLMLVFRTTKPEFYRSYLEAAHIGLTNRKKKHNGIIITGQAIDFETHQPIAGAKIKILLQQAETYTGNDGNFSLTIPAPGEITIKAEKTGYTLWEDDLIIEQGESVSVLVEMEKVQNE